MDRDEERVSRGFPDVRHRVDGQPLEDAPMTFLRSVDRLLQRATLWRRASTHSRFRDAPGFAPPLWTRKVADEEVRELIRALDPARLSVLEISGEVWRSYGFGEYRSVSYPKFDLCAQVLQERFDLIIAEHVFEHLLWPCRAGRNVCEMLRPGGRFLVVTPFIYKVHANPYDCTRWTETGLRYLLAECGFALGGIQTGSWGNRAVIESTFRWEYTLFNRHVHSLENDPDLPIVVWALAQK
jgi:SAM-dependent methyltransferase